MTRKWAEARSKILCQAAPNTGPSRSLLVDRPAIGLWMPSECLAGGAASIGPKPVLIAPWRVFAGRWDDRRHRVRPPT